MQKFMGVLAMSVMLMLAACGGGQALTTKTYTTSQAVVIPAGVSNLVLVSGQGAAGTPSGTQYVALYSRNTKTYNVRNDIGGQVVVGDQGTDFFYGATPADYCDPATEYMQNGVKNVTQTCYFFKDASYYDTTPATTGAAATGFGKTFPGGVGGPASAQSFSDVAVVAGQSYNIVVPAGGSITISYY